MNLKRYSSSSTWVFGVVLMLCVALYGLTLRNGYSVDDHLVVQDLEMVQKGISGIPEILTSYYSKTEIGTPFAYRPLTRVTFAIEHSIWGEQIWLSHLMNVLLYACVVFMFLQLLIRIMGEEHRQIILLASFLFLIHPIHTEAVCSLKNREELLSLLFALISSNMLIRFLDNRNWSVYFGALIFFLLSLASKEGQVPLAGIMVLGLLLFRKKHGMKDLALVGLPYFILFGIYFNTVTHLFPLNIRTEYVFEESPLNFYPNMLDRLPTACTALYHYIRLVVFPHPLAFFYGHDQIPVVGWNAPLVWVGVAMLIASLIAFVLSWKREPILAFGIGIFFIGISQFLNVIVGMPGIIAERWLLASSMGWCLIMSLMIMKIWERKGLKPIAMGTVIVLSGLYGFKTIDRVPDWKSHRSLVYQDVHSAPRSFVVNFMAANFHEEDAQKASNEQKRKTELRSALKNYAVLAEISSSKPRYLSKCAKLNSQLGQSEKAIEYSLLLYHASAGKINQQLTALEILVMNGAITQGSELATLLHNEYPNRPEPLIHLGNFQLMSGDTVSAISYYQGALNLNFQDPGFETFVRDLKASL